MMVALELCFLCLIVALCYLCTKSDLTAGMIYNKILGGFLILAILLDAVYYGLFVRDMTIEFLINVGIVAAVSLYLFYSHTFAGGDCKMMIVLSLLFPARWYWCLGTSNATLIFVIAFAIFAGYCYLLGYSVIAIITKRVPMTLNYVREYLMNFLKSYVSAIVYIYLFNFGISLLYAQGFEMNIWIPRILCILVSWCVSKYPAFKKWFIFVPASGIVIAISIITKSLPISLNPESYVLVLVLLLCQMTIRTTIYEKVEVSQLKKGMILTTFSSIPMQSSITKGLPGVSTEDLKSRLTEDEITSIKIWAKATHTETLTIVKKIPFAIFISIGVLLYCAVWGLLI